MVDQKIDPEIVDSTTAIETALSALWEKAREASLLISTLRDEKKSLLQRIEDLEEDVKQSHNDAILKQTAIEQLRIELTEHSSGSKTLVVNGMSEDEKREFEHKLKTIISKLDQYLSP
ncbi:MAG: hypothetical protein WCT99_00055 [Bacteroidota bacterium]|jgi:hypothetical protein